VRTERSPRLTLVSGTGGEEESGRALTPFGPVRAGLTNTQITPDQRLTELLNCLEREVAILESKYYEVCDTWISVSEHLVKLGNFTSDTGGTDTLKS
jgi:hypothetical protein